MPTIQNISRREAASGQYNFDASVPSVLIQIVDLGMDFPVSPHVFKKTFGFEFLDVDDTERDLTLYEVGQISWDQAANLVDILIDALDSDMNVVVHCNAGISRSGAVVEIGEMIGFDHCPRFRAPNLLVKSRMRTILEDRI